MQDSLGPGTQVYDSLRRKTVSVKNEAGPHSSTEDFLGQVEASLVDADMVALREGMD